MPSISLPNNPGYLKFFRRFDCLKLRPWGVALGLNALIQPDKIDGLYAYFGRTLRKDIDALKKTDPVGFHALLSNRVGCEKDLSDEVYLMSQTSAEELSRISKPLGDLNERLIPYAAPIRQILDAGGNVGIISNVGHYVYFPRLFLTSMGLTEAEINRILIIRGSSFMGSMDSHLNELMDKFDISHPKDLLFIDNESSALDSALESGFPVFNSTSKEGLFSSINSFIKEKSSSFLEKRPTEFRI